MKNISRILIALTVFFFGAALIPVVGLPVQGFRWQRYAGAYNPAGLVSNHPGGKLGSFFTLEGENFTPNSHVTISVNGAVLGSVQTDAQGKLRFVLNTAGSEAGYYRIRAAGSQSASFLLHLQNDGVQWPREDNTAVLFILPPGIEIHIIFLPNINN